MKNSVRFTSLAALVMVMFPLRGAEPPRKRPNLVIMISVDMLSGEMDRYGAGLPGGLGRLQREGVFFENAFHDYAFTETGPGHSVLLSGRHPASTGITENQWRDRATGKTVYCVQDPSVKNFGEHSGKAGSSAVWFRGTTFGIAPGGRTVPGSRADVAAGHSAPAWRLLPARVLPGSSLDPDHWPGETRWRARGDRGQRGHCLRRNRAKCCFCSIRNKYTTSEDHAPNSSF